MADFCTFLHSLFRLFSSSVIREGSHQLMSEAGRKLGACGVLRVAACVRWPRRGPAVGVQCKSGQAALAINIATTSLQCINESTKRAEPPALAALISMAHPRVMAATRPEASAPKEAEVQARLLLHQKCQVQ